VEPVVERMVELAIKLVVQPTVQSQLEPLVVNYDNFCVVNEYSLLKNLDIGTSNVLVEPNSLTSMPSLEDVTPTVNSLQGLQ